MKLTRIAAGVASIALVAGATLLGAAPASADDIDVTLPTPLPAEDPAGYAPTWFAGDVTGGNGTLVQDETGAVITGGTAGYQLLNGAPEDDAALTLSAALSYQAVSAVGDAFFQLAVFGEPGAEFTTLRPVDADDTWGSWYTSQPVAGLLPDTEYTKDELIAALDAGSPAKVLAFGVFVNAGDTVTVRGIYFNNDSYLFADAPTLTVAPTSLQVSETSKPVTLTATGFAADELVYIGVGTDNGGGIVAEVNADANGNISYAVDVTGYELGDYTFSVSDEAGLFYALAEFSIVANALAATGIEFTAPLIGAGVLLVAGAVFLTLRRRNSVSA